MKLPYVIGTCLGGVFLVFGLVLFLTAVWPSLFRHDKIEKLTNPIAVRDVRDEGLVLEDGRLLPLRFVKEINKTNEVFRSALARGVDVSADGTVFGLIDVRHWCGNDPIRRHVAKVDLSALALYYGAIPTQEVPTWILEWDDSRFARRFDPGQYGNVRIIEAFLRKQTPTSGSR